MCRLELDLLLVLSPDSECELSVTATDPESSLSGTDWWVVPVSSCSICWPFTCTSVCASLGVVISTRAWPVVAESEDSSLEGCGVVIVALVVKSDLSVDSGEDCELTEISVFCCT